MEDGGRRKAPLVEDMSEGPYKNLGGGGVGGGGGRWKNRRRKQREYEGRVSFGDTRHADTQR